ncbi:MAG: YrbL family protein [Oleiphilaceae bacterium]|nr:YrbL family protein [Oleiphilaceae bacterium]
MSSPSPMPLSLIQQAPFARGGNRLCFVHPWDSGRCIKVRRPDYPLQALRRDKGFPRNLKPLSAFDDNAEEYRVLLGFQRRQGESVFRHVSRCHGFVDTDLGPGLVNELVRNPDGHIAPTLKWYLWQHGTGEDLERAVSDLIRCWRDLRVPSRELLLHNIVVQSDPDGRVRRLVVIDGLGSPLLLPFHWLPTGRQRARVERVIARFRERLEQLAQRRRQGGDFPGLRGHLLHSGKEPQP